MAEEYRWVWSGEDGEIHEFTATNATAMALFKILLEGVRAGEQVNFGGEQGPQWQGRIIRKFGKIVDRSPFQFIQELDQFDG